MTSIEKPWNETEFSRRLQQGEVQFPPAQIRLIDAKEKGTCGGADGVLEIAWQGESPRFVYEYRASSTPKAVETAMLQVQRYARQLNLLPLVITPYLSEQALRLLEAEEVSGIDLSGNGILNAPGLAVWRSGRPNRFKESQPLRNVYRGNISLLTRAFLLQNEFSSLAALRAFVLQRLLLPSGATAESLLTKGTVSKVVQVLDAEKIVLRDKESVRLTSPQRLLEGLRTSAVRPRGRGILGKTPLSAEEVWNRLNARGIRAVVTGEGSAGRYRVLSGMDKLALYVDHLEEVVDLLEVKETRVFPNLQLIEENSDVVYFDTRQEGLVRWASPIQAWLELSLGGPREREAAQSLETALLEGQADSLL
ncbi:MAG: hypothetical protein NT023_05690 [Armatimonadetes bacterium]|nr:hypothetical protein [Armatimonadota bacterium]